MNEARFKELLNQRAVAVVHFSHHAVMGHMVEFPYDLIHAIEHFAVETRSCCAIFPDHNLELPGSVGIVFEPLYFQVVSVCQSDSGSSDFGGEEGSMGIPPNEEAILESLNVPNGSYNEWRIRGATPKGIYISDIKKILAKKATILSFGDEESIEIGCTIISLAQVCEAFPKLPIFTMGMQGLEELPRPTNV